MGVSEEDLFLAAVSYALRRGKINSADAASSSASRHTETSFVLADNNGQFIERIPLQRVLEEAERLRNSSGIHDRQQKIPEIRSSIIQEAKQSDQLIPLQEVNRQKLNPVIGCLAGIGSLVVVFVGCSALFFGGTKPPTSQPNIDATKEEKPEESVKDLSWIPAGFKAWNEKVAWKYGEQSYGEGPDCSSNQSCFQVEIVPKDGCNNLYVSAALLNSDNANIGFTNDLTTGVGAGERAIMTLSTFEDNLDSIRVQEINCY
jgi:hypothetical protein